MDLTEILLVLEQGLLSMARHFPSAVRVMFKRKEWVWVCGSCSREIWWS